MTNYELDDVDRGILHLLQVDARNNSPADIADHVGVAPNTVRNRMEQLETHGIITGYHPEIDYERGGYQLHVLFICTVPITERQSLSDEVMQVDGVERVLETLSSQENLAIEAVGNDSEDLVRIAAALEDLGCVIDDEWFLQRSRSRPFNHFGVEEATDQK